MALTDERLKEIEAEVGSQPYSVVLGLVFEIRYLRKELKESRDTALDDAAKAVKALARKHADKIIGEDTEEAEIHRKSEAWMMLQCQHEILALKSAGNAVGASGNTQNTMGSSEKTK